MPFDRASSLERKRLEFLDWTELYARLVKLSSNGNPKSAALIADPDKAICSIIDQDREGSGHAAMVGGIFVFFAVGTPWYSRTPLLSELLVVRVRPGGTLKDVARSLEREAAAAGASRVVIGTAFATNDRALSRIWQRLGYREEAITLSKEI